MLDDAEHQLRARFAELVAMRRPLGFPVYALEHGLAPDVIEQLRVAASDELRRIGLKRSHWHIWMALAAEAGYRYAGEEYWPFLERQQGEWRDNGLRNQLRHWFCQFHHDYDGPMPKGRWAAQFNIIAWPINNAILPRYLQDHFARHLFDLRYDLAHHARLDASAIGQFLFERYKGAESSRFGYFLQQTDVTGAIVLALREEADATAVPRIASALLARIVGDLEAKRIARDYLREARAVLNTQTFTVGLGLRGGSGVASTRDGGGGVAPIVTPRLAAKLVAGEGLVIGVILPDFSAALSKTGLDRAAFAGVRVRITVGEDERWTPASSLLTLSGRERRLSCLPQPGGPIIELQGAAQSLHAIIDPLSYLEERPCWVLRRFSDGIYRQAVQGHVRASQAYIVLARRPLTEADISATGLTLLLGNIPNLHAYRLSTLSRITEAQIAALARLKIGVKASVSVEPAGLAPCPSGEGAVPTWLSTEFIVLRLVADHEVASFVVRVDGGDPVRFPVQSRDTLLALDPLAIGRHQLELAAMREQDGSRGEAVTAAQFAFEVRAPQPWPEAIRGKSGFRLVLSPANASLEEVLAGRSVPSVIGPAGRQVQWSLDTFDAGGNRVTTSMGSRTDSRATSTVIAQAIIRLRVANSDAIDAAHGVDIRASIDELGGQTLRFSHKVEPLRWVFNSKERRVRLIDETAHEEPIQILGSPLAAPLERLKFSSEVMIAGRRVECPGMLFNARYRGRSQTALVSVPARESFQSFAELQPSQDTTLPADRAEALLLLIRTLSLWTRARPLGHLALLNKDATLKRLRHELAVVACGNNFVRAIEEDGAGGLQRAREMVGGSPGFQARMCSHPWSDILHEATEAFAGFAHTYRVEENAGHATDAFTLARAPLRLRIGYGPMAEEKARRLIANTTLLRGAFLAQVQASTTRTGHMAAVNR